MKPYFRLCINFLLWYQMFAWFSPTERVDKYWVAIFRCCCRFGTGVDHTTCRTGPRKFEYERWIGSTLPRLLGDNPIPQSIFTKWFYCFQTNIWGIRFPLSYSSVYTLLPHHTHAHNDFGRNINDCCENCQSARMHNVGIICDNARREAIAICSFVCCNVECERNYCKS